MLKCIEHDCSGSVFTVKQNKRKPGNVLTNGHQKGMAHNVPPCQLNRGEANGLRASASLTYVYSSGYRNPGTLIHVTQKVGHILSVLLVCPVFFSLFLNRQLHRTCLLMIFHI
ncbi:hypothetical protein AMECASPLE_010410 [Ameca splendens]|uniref:Uncharacterized protein n=1 Tax=Ameca splendens TaxID=208324 RepID=A0ABV0ZLA1_9TELE